MHDEIMHPPDGQEVDHKDSDPLNNQKDNLRNCLHEENGKNRRRNSASTTGFKGVTYSKKKRLYEARITIDYECLFLGYFDTAREAADAYDLASQEFHGHFGRPNNPIPEQSTFPADWGYITEILKVRRIPPAMGEVIRQSMALAAAKQKVNIEAKDDLERRAARRIALLEIFNSYGGKDRGA